MRSPLRACILSASSLLGSLAACASGPAPSPPGETAPPVAPAPRPSPSPPASPSAPASVSAPVGPVASASVAPAPAPIQVPALFGALFDPKKTWSYSYTSSVDTHSTDPGASRVVERGTTRCKVSEVKALPGARASVVTCEQPRQKGGDALEPLDTLEEGYLATEAALWILPTTMLDAVDVKEITGERPYLEATPQARREQGQSAPDEQPPYRTSLVIERRAVRVKGRAVASWCRQDSSTQLYGRLEARCFAPGVGLTSRAAKGRRGPSEEDLTLLELP